MAEEERRAGDGFVERPGAVRQAAGAQVGQGGGDARVGRVVAQAGQHVQGGQQPVVEVGVLEGLPGVGGAAARFHRLHQPLEQGLGGETDGRAGGDGEDQRCGAQEVERGAQAARPARLAGEHPVRALGGEQPGVGGLGARVVAVAELGQEADDAGLGAGLGGLVPDQALPGDAAQAAELAVGVLVPGQELPGPADVVVAAADAQVGQDREGPEGAGMPGEVVVGPAPVAAGLLGRQQRGHGRVGRDNGAGRADARVIGRAVEQIDRGAVADVGVITGEQPVEDRLGSHGCAVRFCLRVMVELAAPRGRAGRSRRAPGCLPLKWMAVQIREINR